MLFLLHICMYNFLQFGHFMCSSLSSVDAEMAKLHTSFVLLYNIWAFLILMNLNQ